jgi:hypothetical protein
VTLGVFIAGEVRLHLAVIYFIMQIIGGKFQFKSNDFNLLMIGIGAAGMLRLIVSQQAYIQCHGGATLLSGEVIMAWWQVIF